MDELDALEGELALEDAVGTAPSYLQVHHKGSDMTCEMILRNMVDMLWHTCYGDVALHCVLCVT